MESSEKGEKEIKQERKIYGKAYGRVYRFKHRRTDERAIEWTKLH